jgi:hypothetical protein
VAAVGEFLASSDRALVCTHATFRFAVEQLGVGAFDGRLIAIDEFHHFSASGDNVLGRAVKPREWFLVPLHVIDEVVARIRDRSVMDYVYLPTAAALVKRQDQSEV